MREIQHFGAAGEVTGSSHLLTDNNNGQVLIDLGGFQGPNEQRNYEPLPFDVKKLNGIILSHAHYDHAGLLPRAVKEGFEGPIYMTHPTAALAKIVLHDSFGIMKSKAPQGEPLPYEEKDLKNAFKMFRPLDFGQQFTTADFSGDLDSTSHILGSAHIRLTEMSSDRPQTIVFSGDLGNNNPQDILKPKSYVDRADIVVMETTYGDKDHSTEDPKDILEEEITEIEKSKGVLLIPAFSIQRTQQLLHLLHEMKDEKRIKSRTKVVVDGYMAKQATQVFRSYRGLLRQDIAEKKTDPFSFDGLVLADKYMRDTGGSKVIIAGSGMMTGGKIRSYAAQYLDRPNTRVLLTGYQAEGSLGRELQEGTEWVNIDSNHVQVNAKIRTLSSMSAHADRTELKKWLAHIEGVTIVDLVHGEDSKREAFARHVYEEQGIKAHLPQHGDIVDLRPNAITSYAAD